jgi:hypothetical protein
VAVDLVNTQKIGFTLNMPIGLRVQLEKAAQDAELTPAQYVRTLIAKQLKYDLPSENGSSRARKYQTEDQRKEAMRARAKEKSAEAAALLAEFRRQVGVEA